MKKYFKYIAIVFVVIYLIGPNIINSIKQSIRDKEIEEIHKENEAYKQTQEYKDKKKKEEYDIKNRYKDTEPFIGMESKYVKHTLWGKPDKEYIRSYNKQDGNGIQYAYIWFSKDKKFKCKNGADEVLRNTYHRYKEGDPLIEREIVVTDGTKRTGYIANAPIYKWLDEITEISDINNIHKYIQD